MLSNCARKLLDNISGFVAPGKLTALMGESGAGKVSYFLLILSVTQVRGVKTTLLNVLAGRQGVGVVSGELFVNGQALPRDFQSQT